MSYLQIRYDEGCLAAHALNIVGDRWALLVVRELMFRPKRFQALRHGMPGITAGVLSQRLKQLDEAGVLIHDEDLGIYTLSESGQALLPVLQAMCHWGVTHPGHDHHRFISPSALMISMTAMVKSETERVSAAFDITGEKFRMDLPGGGTARVTPARDLSDDLAFIGTGNALASVVYGKVPVTTHLKVGNFELVGDAAAAQDFVDQFQMRGASR